MSSNKAIRQVSFSPDIQEKPTIPHKHGTRLLGITTNRKKRSVAAGIFAFRLPKSSSKYSPARILRRLGAKVARVVHFVAMRRKQSKVSSSASLTRSRSVVDAIDSQRAEAVEDCIEFLNSSSLQRSNSVSSVSNY